MREARLPPSSEPQHGSPQAVGLYSGLTVDKVLPPDEKVVHYFDSIVAFSSDRLVVAGQVVKAHSLAPH